MRRKLLKNDFRKNKWNNLLLLLLMTLSVTLVVSVFFLSAQLFTSISSMYKISNPPHFMQMHKGELRQTAIDSFNREYEGIRHWQTVPMIDVYGEELSVTGDGSQFTLRDCRLDISLVQQNREYDVLLDAKRNPVQVKQGEIGVPVILLEQFPIAMGTTIHLQSGAIEKDFLVTEYVYDGQMNSTMCSSTRFLISNADFQELFGQVGETEYLIEAYFTDSALAGDYQSAYEKSEWNLPKGGQAVTYPIIFLLSAMTDLMTAIIFLIGGILLIVVALLCLRYTILAAIEEDVREIGTMKAIGIPGLGIRELYLYKIRVLMLTGCVLGYGGAFLGSSILTGHMNRTFGEQSLPLQYRILAIGICFLLYVIILLFTRTILHRIKKATVVDLLVLEKGFGKEHTAKDGMHRFKKLPINLLMGLQELRRGYGIIVILLGLVSILILLPCQLTHTMEDPAFITYMGSAVYDVLLEVEQGSDLEERREIAEGLLKTEQEQGSIRDLAYTRRVRLQAEDADGRWQGIHVDTGEGAGFGLQYLSGYHPTNRQEIAISSLLADELGKTTGEIITLTENEWQQDFVISGIYQDVTSGGKTAKMLYDVSAAEAEQYTFQINLTDRVNQETRIEQWRKNLGNGYVVENMEEFIGQTLGGMIQQINLGSRVLFFIGNALIIVITLLYLRLRIISQARYLAGKRAMGIPYRGICRQELYPVLLAGVSGILAGILVTNLLGDKVVSLLLGSMGMGLKKVEFTMLPLLQGLGIPMLLTGILVITTLGACRQIHKIQITKF